MRDALLRDFSDVTDIDIVTTYDVRLAKPESAVQAIFVDEEENPEIIWQQHLTDCDACLIVAPETGGILCQLTQMVEAQAVQNLGSHSSAVAIASNKYETYQWLMKANIATLPSYTAYEVLEAPLNSVNGFIVKPNDGAGCEATNYFADKPALVTWLANHTHENLIIQPYQQGQAASISALFKQGQAWVLSCNEQMIDIQEDNHVHLIGCRVNAFHQYLAVFNQLVKQIAIALPTLNGYAGIDVIIEGNNVFVVEINPRITTSYIGLRESLGYNPAKLILDSILSPTFELPLGLNKNIVDIHLNA